MLNKIDVKHAQNTKKQPQQIQQKHKKDGAHLSFLSPPPHCVSSYMFTNQYKLNSQYPMYLKCNIMQ